MAVEAIPTGSLSLDLALGIGGIPRGRVTEIFGAEASGKTTLAQHIIAEAQKLGGIAVYVDAEHALDTTYAANCGVNVEDLRISQPDDGEEALGITEELVRSGAVDVIVIDSVAALVPRAEIEGEVGDARIDLRRIDSLKQGAEVVGTRVRARVVKNKMAPPFRSAEFDIMFKRTKYGISKEGDIIDMGVALGMIKKAGTFFTYGDLKLRQGRENTRDYLLQHSDVASNIEREIRAVAMALPNPGAQAKELSE